MESRLLKCDFNHHDIEPANGDSFELEELYKLLDCDTIEIVHLRTMEGEMNDEILIIDEEGKFNNPTFNLAATDLYWKGHFSKKEYKKHSAGLNFYGARYATANNLDWIAGNAIHCHTTKLK